MLKMEQNNGTHGGLLLLAFSWLLNAASMLDRNTISFILGTIATILAIVHYIVKIKNDSQKK